MPVLARHVVLATEEKEAELARAAGGRPVELLPRLQHLALTVAGRSMFSLEMAEFGDELRAMLLRYARDFARPGFLDLLLPASMRSPLDIRRAAFRAEWLRLVDRHDRRAGAAGGAARRPTGRATCSTCSPPRATRRPARASTGAQLRDEVATLILAGHETTAASLVLGLLRRVPAAGAPGAHRRRGGRPRPLGGQRRGRAQAAAASPAPSWTRPCASTRRSS